MRTVCLFQRRCRKLILFAIAVGVCIAAVGTVARADGPSAYYIDSASFFGTIDLSTGTQTRISQTMSGMNGLGEANGVLYTVSNDTSTLYSINTSTGALTKVGTTNSGIEYSAFGSTTSGLYAIGWKPAVSDQYWYLFSIDPSTGVATQIGGEFSTTLGNQSGSGITYVLSTGSSTLYGVGYEGSSFGLQLYTFDLSGGVPTAVGTAANQGNFGLQWRIALGPRRRTTRR